LGTGGLGTGGLGASAGTGPATGSGSSSIGIGGLSGMNAQAVAEAVAGLDAAERAQLAQRCATVLANPSGHKRETVAVCRVVAAR
jgi:hypothetical protein